jgi:hypothetical protein
MTIPNEDNRYKVMTIPNEDPCFTWVNNRKT